jgi:hypothetical protein
VANCNLVGNLNLGIEDACVISVSVSSNTEFAGICDDQLLEGATTGSVNISAYGDTDVWYGEPCKAGVSIPYVKKYDCTNGRDEVHLIFQGRGQSFYTGNADEYVSIFKEANIKSTSLNASSSSGPASLYELQTQTNGYGLSYSGDPFDFSTDPNGTEISLGGIFSGNTYYLQNFNLELQSGSLPIVTYSLVYVINTV